MKKIYFTTKKEAYEAVFGSLQAKVNIIKAKGFHNLKEADLFDYFVTKKWKAINEVSLSEMVSDILSIDNEQIIKYFKIKNFLKEGEK